LFTFGKTAKFVGFYPVFKTPIILLPTLLDLVFFLFFFHAPNGLVHKYKAILGCLKTRYFVSFLGRS
jgi:hypothetical protein